MKRVVRMGAIAAFGGYLALGPRVELVPGGVKRAVELAAGQHERLHAPGRAAIRQARSPLAVDEVDSHSSEMSTCAATSQYVATSSKLSVTGSRP